ncbi:MAG: glutamate--tRNA ligase [Planctomycetota bacterium]|nr:glutamate--tRNA ligase [Planctomycetota bacterium]
MTTQVRVRFAPSPTGPLHVGGARTALFNWLYARRHGGVFVLRIEDTDRKRSTDESLENLKQGLRWLGIEWDEGPEKGGPYGPYFQSQRQSIYQPYVARLLDGRGAYRCFCPPERIEALREDLRRRKLNPRYDRVCRDIGLEESEARAGKGEPFTVRLRVPDGETVIEDLIKGDRTIVHAEIDDLILVRTDGTPTYNLVAAIDDLEMKITHAIRGDDHFTNTPKQLLIIRALGAEPPAYGHIPLILGADKVPLSKRHGSTAVAEYRKQGYPPTALVNYLALLGWSYDDKTEIMSRDELVERFSLDRVTRSGSVFDREKLDWMSGEYIREMALQEVIDLILPHLVKAGYLTESDAEAKRPLIEAVARAMQPRIRYGADITVKVAYLFQDNISYDAKAEKNLRKRPEISDWLRAFREWLGDQDFSGSAGLETGARGFAEARGIKFGQLVHPTRAALTGTTTGPGLFDVMGILGKERTLARLASAEAYLGPQGPS